LEKKKEKEKEAKDRQYNDQNEKGQTMIYKTLLDLLDLFPCLLVEYGAMNESSLF
jgi:hypothetical protein